MLSAQKLHRPELGEVSYHWAMGKQQGGYRNRLRKVFSRSHHAAFSKKTGSTSGASKKKSGDFAEPLAVCKRAVPLRFQRQLHTPNRRYTFTGDLRRIVDRMPTLQQMHYGSQYPNGP
jgi:hypothetical protein